MQNISFTRYSAVGDDPALTAQLIETYRDVFADGPWHEWLKCPHCQKYWGKQDASLLAKLGFRHCDQSLIDFWPRNLVATDLQHEITTDASCWLTLSGGDVIGFCWGYPITVAILEAKLDLHLPIIGGTKIAYQDEVGVISSYRGCKIAKKMVALRLNDFLNQSLEIGIVRTRRRPEPSTTFSWYTEKLGYEIMAEYPGNDGRVILGRELRGLMNLL